MRAKSFHGARNRPRPQETSQNTFAIRYKMRAESFHGAPHCEKSLQLDKKHAKSFHGDPNREKPKEASQNTYSIRYTCMLNLSMGLKKHRNTHIRLDTNACKICQRDS